MIKKLYISLFILPFLSLGQSDRIAGDLTYGHLLYKSDFYTQANTVDKKNWKLPTRFIGVHAKDYIVTVNPKGGYYTGGYGMNYYLPSDVIIDSAKAKISGYAFSLDIGSVLFRRVNNFKLYIHTGFIAGGNSIKFSNSLYKNPFFSPKIVITPKIYIKRFYIGVSAGYNHDISKVHWMRKKGDSYNINGWDQSCYNLQLHIGITHG